MIKVKTILYIYQFTNAKLVCWSVRNPSGPVLSLDVVAVTFTKSTKRTFVLLSRIIFKEGE